MLDGIALRMYRSTSIVVNPKNTMFCRATAIPLAAIPSTGDLPRASGDQTKEQWKAMAVSSGWSPDFQRKKALEAFLGSLRALKTFI